MPTLRRLHIVALFLSLCVQRMLSQPAVTDSLAQYTREELMGKFSPAKHSAFQLIEARYSTKTDIYLRKEAYDAFKRMHAAALKDGITLTILSATRNFDAQKAIWERKWKRPLYEGKSDLERIIDIMQFSSMPGTSRHHWGTDIDMNSLEPGYFKDGKGLIIYDWLTKHGPEYGFYQTYTTKKEGRSGYDEEAWHWSYMPLAGPMLAAYNRLISYEDLTGFSGCTSADKARVLEEFVNGIAPELKK